MRILRKVRTEFDFKTYLEENYTPKYATNGELRICCPNCGENAYKCYVNDDTKRFNCFKCDFNNGNYDVFDFVALTEGIHRDAAMLRLIREYADTAATYGDLEGAFTADVEEEYYQPIKVIPSLPDEAKPLTNPEIDEQKPFWEYLLNRGFYKDDVLTVKAHYVPDGHARIFNSHGRGMGDIGRRVIFPVYGGSHKLVSWLGRATDDKLPKYLNAPETEMARTLWPFVPTSKDRVVLVEGLIDALSVRRQGLPAYATFGKKISNDQIKLLNGWGITEIVLFYDVDAKKDMGRIIKELKTFFKVWVPDFTDWPKDKDAGDALKTEQLGAQMKEMLECKLIDVNSWEFTTWDLM